MNDYQENQLLTILSDFIPLMDGDIIQGISPEAGGLTRQKVLGQLRADKELLNKEDTSLVSWQEENIQLLETISDDDFQAVVEEKILLTEIQIGQSLFEPLSENQLERLAEKLKIDQPSASEHQEASEDQSEKKEPFFSRFFKTQR